MQTDHKSSLVSGHKEGLLLVTTLLLTVRAVAPGTQRCPSLRRCLARTKRRNGQIGWHNTAVRTASSLGFGRQVMQAYHFI